MRMLVADQHALARAPHAMLLVVLLQAVQTCQDRRVFLRLVVLGTERVVAQRIQADRLGLVRAKGGRQYRARWGRSTLGLEVFRGDDRPR